MGPAAVALPRKKKEERKRLIVAQCKPRYDLGQVPADRTLLVSAAFEYNGPSTERGQCGVGRCPPLTSAASQGN